MNPDKNIYKSTIHVHYYEMWLHLPQYLQRRLKRGNFTWTQMTKYGTFVFKSDDLTIVLRVKIKISLTPEMLIDFSLLLAKNRCNF